MVVVVVVVLAAVVAAAVAAAVDAAVQKCLRTRRLTGRASFVPHVPLPETHDFEGVLVGGHAQRGIGVVQQGHLTTVPRSRPCKYCTCMAPQWQSAKRLTCSKMGTSVHISLLRARRDNTPYIQTHTQTHLHTYTYTHLWLGGDTFLLKIEQKLL